MRELVTAIDVDAPRPVVWATLVDFSAYPEWNPYVRQVTGTPEVGARLEIVSERPAGGTRRFSPRVIACEPDSRLAWRSTVLTRRLFEIRHEFELRPLGEGRVRFIQRESFGGLLAPLGARALRQARPSFEAMNDALKRRVEEGAGG